MTNTAAKRNSAMHFLKSGITPIFPDGTIIQEDRQSSVHSYGGILANALGTVNAGLNSDQTIWFFFDD
jgi:hypothetical protein